MQQTQVLTVERRRVVLMVAAVAALHLLGWGGLLLAQGAAAAAAIGVGLGVTAYTLGMRHAFDADHIAAIDNTTRTLMRTGQRPLSVGFWFALGHSSVVFGMTLAVVVGIKALTSGVRDDDSVLHAVTGVWGPLVSGLFLTLIALVNLTVLVRLVRGARRARAGEDIDDLERHGHGGWVFRAVQKAGRTVRKPWHMYVVGLLFGLGFDTATEISLLVLAGGAAASTLPWYAVMALPVLFAAGMTLFDSLDGYVMTRAYGWTADNPQRRLYYNITVTGLSVAVALLIGGTGLLGLLAERLALTGGAWDWLRLLDLEYLGYVVVALFLAVWLAAAVTWRLRRRAPRPAD